MKRILFSVCLLGSLILVSVVPHSSLATVNTTTRTVTYTGSGGKEFSIPYPFQSDTYLEVTVTTIATQVEAVLTLATDYTVEKVGLHAGILTLTDAYGDLENTHTITIAREIPILQPTSLRTNARFRPKTHEEVFDRLTMIAQQLTDDVTQSAETSTAITNHIASADDHTAYFKLAGRAGGQTGYGGTAASENLTLTSTAHATKGNVVITDCTYDEGTSVTCTVDFSSDGDVTAGVNFYGPQLYGGTGSGDDLDINSTENATKGDLCLGSTVLVDETNHRVHVNTSCTAPSYTFQVTGDAYVSTDAYMVGIVYGSIASGGDLDLRSTEHATKGHIYFGNASGYDETNTRLGIGTKTPSYPLHVVGEIYTSTDVTTVDDVTVGDDLVVTDDATIPDIYGGTGAGDDLSLHSTSNGTKGHVYLGTTSAYDETQKRFGIGTLTPAEALHVVGDVYATIDVNADGNVTATGNVTAGDNASVGLDLTVSGNTYTPRVYGGTAAGNDLYLESTSNATEGNLFFGDSGLHTFDEVNGKWGLGTATPAEVLHVVGDIRATVDLDIDNSANVDNDLTVGDDASITGDLTVGGNFYIPYLYGGSGAGDDIFIGSTSNATKGTVTIGNEITVLEASGFVGVNEVAPTVELMVGGTCRAADLDATDDLTVADDATVSDDLAVGGDITMTGNFYGSSVFGSAASAADLYLRSNPSSNGKIYLGDSDLNYIDETTDEANFGNNAAAVTFGRQATNADVVLAFDAVSNQGSITYKEDEDEFAFDYDVEVGYDLTVNHDITGGNNLTISDSATIPGIIKLGPDTCATLPVAGTAGRIAFVTDSTELLCCDDGGAWRVCAAKATLCCPP
jgi:predicted acyltransferase (DUF342 family)